MRVSQLPLSAGACFKPEHFAAISAAPQPLGFFEVHAENYMGTGGTPHVPFRFLRVNYALSLHGVGLNIGSTGPLDRAHLARLKEHCDRYQPESFSEHLAWSSHRRIFFQRPPSAALYRDGPDLGRSCRRDRARAPSSPGKPSNLCALRGSDDSRDRVLARGRARPARDRLWTFARRQQCVRFGAQSWHGR